jgi:signal transduction histidine kinase
MVPAGLRLVAVGGVIVLASWFVLSGIAQGVGAMFGDRAWIGDLITGAMALVAVGLGVSCAASMRDSASRKRTVEKYESRHAQQRTRFGRDVHD